MDSNSDSEYIERTFEEHIDALDLQWLLADATSVVKQTLELCKQMHLCNSMYYDTAINKGGFHGGLTIRQLRMLQDFCARRGEEREVFCKDEGHQNVWGDGVGAQWWRMRCAAVRRLKETIKANKKRKISQ